MRGFATRFTETDWITSCRGIGFQTFAICIAYYDLPLSGGNELPFQYRCQQVDIQSTNACPDVSSMIHPGCRHPGWCPASQGRNQTHSTETPGLAQGWAELITPASHPAIVAFLPLDLDRCVQLNTANCFSVCRHWPVL